MVPVKTRTKKLSKTDEAALQHYFEVKVQVAKLKKSEEGMKDVALDIINKHGGRVEGKQGWYNIAEQVKHPVSYKTAIMSLRKKLTKKMQDACDEIIEENTGESTSYTPKMIEK